MGAVILTSCISSSSLSGHDSRRIYSTLSSPKTLALDSCERSIQKKSLSSLKFATENCEINESPLIPLPPINSPTPILPQENKISHLKNSDNIKQNTHSHIFSKETQANVSLHPPTSSKSDGNLCVRASKKSPQPSYGHSQAQQCCGGFGTNGSAKDRLQSNSCTIL